MSVISQERFLKGFTWPDYMKDIEKNIEQFHERYEAFELDPEDAAFFSKYRTPVNILILGEDWCGDVVRNLPPIVRILECSEALQYRIFKRDENTDIMDRYLTDGTRSIPYLVFMDTDFNERARWGPRPKDCQQIMRSNKGKIPMDQIYPQIRAWYVEHGDGPLVRELRSILEQIAA